MIREDREIGYVYAPVWVGDPWARRAGVIVVPVPVQGAAARLSSGLRREVEAGAGPIGRSVGMFVRRLQGAAPMEAWRKESARRANYVWIGPPMAGVTEDLEGEADRLLEESRADYWASR